MNFLQYVPLWRKYLLSCTLGGLRLAAGQHHLAAAIPQLFRWRRDSVRGYRESRLGPKDNINGGNPYGGNFRIVATGAHISSA